MPPPDGPPEAPGAAKLPVRVVDLDWRSVAVVLAAFVGLVVLTGFVRSVPRTLSALAVATILVLGLNPVVSLTARRLRVPRPTAMVVVMVLFVGAFAALAAVLVPPGVREARELGQDLPEVIADLGRLPVVGDDLVRAGVLDDVERFVEDLPRRLTGEDTPLPRLGRSAVDGLLAALVTLLFAVTLLLDGERLLRAGQRVLPHRFRSRAERLADLAYRVVGRYVAGSLLVALVAGLVTLVAGLALGVPLTPLLAAWVALWDLVPQIGGAAGGIPFVLLGFTQGAVVGAACAVFFVVYLQIENHVLGPLLVGRAVRLSPPATMTAALVGVSAGGVVGALLAVPLLGAAKVVYHELRPAPGTGEPEPGGPEQRGPAAGTGEPADGIGEPESGGREQGGSATARPQPEQGEPERGERAAGIGEPESGGPEHASTGGPEQGGPGTARPQPERTDPPPAS